MGSLGGGRFGGGLVALGTLHKTKKMNCGHNKGDVTRAD